MSLQDKLISKVKSSSQTDDTGVSPVIGVILMVAITVALVALVTVTVFDLGGDVGASPDATVQFDESDSELSAQILRNQNVESFKLVAPDGSVIGTSADVGSSIKDSSKQKGKYKMVAVMPDGREEVIQSELVQDTSIIRITDYSYTGSSFDVSSESSISTSLIFREDGSKMYVIDVSNSNIYSYNLNDNYDVTTASYTGNSFDFSSQKSDPISAEFSNDGSKLFVAENQFGSDSNSVYQYSLSTDYDITTLSYNNKKFNLSTEDKSPKSIAFDDSGNRMYMLGDRSLTIYSYSLTTSYDVTTASYTGNSIDFSSNIDSAKYIGFNNDGSKLFTSGDKIYEYKLTTPYDISSFSYTGNSFSSEETSFIESVSFKSDMKKMFILGGGSVYSYTE